MFEGLLEKILLSYFGKYINDINKNDLSLGIMQGDFTISNVSLKPEILQLVDLPLELRFSFIEKLIIQIPWKQIFSQPVKITIQNLYATVTPKEQWDMSKIHSFENKQSLLETFVRKLIEKKADQNAGGNSNDKRGVSQSTIQANGGINSGGAGGKKKEGFVDRLIARIIDNVQIVITNMHLRFEYTLEKPYFSWGIFLQSLKIQTMEENFSTPKFFNRSAKDNKNKPIFKLVELKTLTAYWNTHETDLWHHKDPRKQKHRMHDLVHGSRKADQLIQVNLNAKITINLDKQGWSKPELDISVDFNDINIHISNRQLQDLLKLVDLFNQYHSALDLEVSRYKPIAFPDPFPLINQQVDYNQRQRLRDEYNRHYLYPLIKRHVKRMRFKHCFIEIFNSKRPIKEVLTPLKYEQYCQILTTTDIEELYEWVTSALNFNEKQKSQGISSYFSYLKFWDYGPSNTNSSVQSGQQNQQQNGMNNSSESSSFFSFFGFIKDQVSQQKIQEFQPTNEDLSEYPSGYISLKFRLTMMKGSAKISRQTRNNTLEEMVCTWNQLSIDFQKSRKQNLIGMQVMNIEIVLNSIIKNLKNTSDVGGNSNLAANPSGQKNNNNNKIPGASLATTNTGAYKYGKNLGNSQLLISQQQQQQKKKGQLEASTAFSSAQFNSNAFKNFNQTEEEGQKKQHQGDSESSDGLDADSEFNKIQLMKKVYQTVEKPLVSLQIDILKNLQTDQVQEINFNCEIQSTEFIYYPTTLKQILQLFQINKQQNQRMNLLAIQKINKIQQQSMQGLEGILEGNKTINIVVDIQSPFIVVPYDMKKNSECWMLDLGTIRIIYREQQSGDIAEKKYFDQIGIIVSNVQMQLYSSLDLCTQYLNILSEEKANFIEQHSLKISKIIEEFTVNLDFLVKKKKADNQNLPKLQLNAAIESIKLNLSEYNLNKFLELMKLFQKLDNEYGKQIMIEEKKNILDLSTKIGILCKRGNTYKKWNEVYTVLSENYLYLYEEPESVSYSSYINLIGYEIKKVSESEVGGQLHSFKLQQRKLKQEIHYFQCSDEESLHQWYTSIKSILDINLQLEALTAIMMGGGNAVGGNTNNVFTAAMNPNAGGNGNTQPQLTMMTEDDQRQTIGSINNFNRENTSINFQLNDPNYNYNGGESFQLDQMSEEKSMRTQTNLNNPQQIPAYQKASMSIEVNFTSIELKVFEQKADRQWIYLKFEGLYLLFSQRQLDYLVQVTLSSFVLEDYKFNYPFRSLHPIIQSTPILQKSSNSYTSNSSNNLGQQNNINKGVYSGNSRSSKVNNRNTLNYNKMSNKPFLKVEFQQIEKSHPLYRKLNADLNIKIEIKDIYINWKPQQIRDIINFFMQWKVKQNYEKFKKSKYDDSQQKYILNRNRQFNARSNLFKMQSQVKPEQIINQSTLLKIEVEINQLNLYLINNYNKNHNLVCSLSAASTSLSIFIKEYELSVSCTIKDLIAQDGMNYPYTKPGWSEKQSNLNDKKQSAPYIFGQKRDPTLEDNVFKMSFRKYDEGHPELVNSIVNKLDLNFQNLEISYFQQPLLRLIDYILEQLLPVCTEEYELNKEMREDPVEMFRRITNPKFTDMRINLSDIAILLKASPSIQNYIKLYASAINIYSNPYQNEKRLLKSPNAQLKDVWAEKMCIDIIQAQLLYKTEFLAFDKPITNKFDYRLQIDRAIFSQEYSLAFSNSNSNKIEIDKQIVITGKIDHLKIKLLREEYLSMMRFIFNNVLFDDYQDAQYFSNYEINKNNLPTPLIYSLNLDYLTLEFHDLFEEISEEQQQQFNNFGNLYDRPLLSFTLQGANLSFNKTPIRKNTFIMNSQKIIGYNISTKQDKDQLLYVIQGFYDTLEEYDVPISIEHEFIIDYVFEQEQLKQLTKVRSQKQQSSPNKKSSLYNGVIPSIIQNLVNVGNEDNQETQNKFTLNCVIEPDGNKTIDITLTNFQLLFGVGFLFNVINFTFMDDTVTVVQPPKKVNPSPMILILDIKNVQIYLQGPSKEYSLACQGKIQISFTKNGNQNLHNEYHQEIPMEEDIDTSYRNEKSIEFSPCSNMKINVSDLELYTHRFGSNGNGQSQQQTNQFSNKDINGVGGGFSTNRSGVFGNSTSNVHHPFHSTNNNNNNFQNNLHGNNPKNNNQQSANINSNNQHGCHRINLVNPCTIFYSSDNYSCSCQENEIKYFNKTELNIQKIRCRFSYKDLAIVYETSLLQSQQMQKVRTFSEKLFDINAFQAQQQSPNLNGTTKFQSKNISSPNLQQIPSSSGQLFNSIMLGPTSQRPSIQFQQHSYSLYGKSPHNVHNVFFNSNFNQNQNIHVEDSDSIESEQSQFQEYHLEEEAEDESECQSEEHQPESQVILSQSPKDVGEYNFINHRNSTTMKETNYQLFSQQPTNQATSYKTQNIKSNRLSTTNQQFSLRHTQSLSLQQGPAQIKSQQTKKIPVTENKQLSYSMSIQELASLDKKFTVEISNMNSPANFAAKSQMMNTIKKAMIDKVQSNYNTQNKTVNSYNYSDKKFTIDGIEIIIINNIGDSYLPVLRTNLIGVITIVSEQDRSLLDGYVTIGVSYYNPYVGRMEPILEESQFQLNLVRGEKANPKFFFILEQVSENTEEHDEKSKKKESIIKITISDTMLGILMNAFQEWQKYIELIRQNNLQFYEVKQTQEEQKHKQKLHNQKNLLKREGSQKETQYRKVSSTRAAGQDMSRLGSLKENDAYPTAIDKIKGSIGGYENNYKSISVTPAFATQEQQQQMQSTPMNQQNRQTNVNENPNQKFQDKITLFSIVNETGYRFVSYCRSGKIEDIKEENNYKFDIEVDSNEEDFTHTFNQEVSLDIFFEDIKGIQHAIKNVKINRQKVVKYNWWLVDFVEGNRTEYKEKYFIQNVEVKDNKTMVIISTPQLFYNLTQKYINFTLDNSEKTQIFNIAPSEKHPLPFEYISKDTSEFTMYFSNPKNYNEKLSFASQSVQIQNLVNLQETEMLEVKHNPYTSYFKTANDKYFMGRILFIIEPILQFKNTLPKKLFLDIYYDNQNKQNSATQQATTTLNTYTNYDSNNPYRISNSINTSNLSLDHQFQSKVGNVQQVTLEKQQVFEVHSANYNSIIKISISIEGMEKSNKIVIFNSEKIKKSQTTQEKVDLYEQKDNYGYIEDDYNLNPIAGHNHHTDVNHYTEAEDENNFASNTAVVRNAHKNLENFITVHINVDVTNTQPLHKIKSKDNDSKTVQKKENEGSQIIKKAKRVFVCFYVKTVLVNSSLFNNITFFDFDELKPRMIVGQSSQFSSQDQKILLMNQEKTLMFSKYGPQYASNEVSIKGIGHTFIEAKIPVSYGEKEDFELYEMGLDVRLIQASPKQKIITKLIHVNPKYVIINKTGFDIDICQHRVEDKPVQMKKDQKRLAWYWKDCTKEKQMCVRINENYLKQVAGDAYYNSTVEWSGAFSIESIRAVHTFCKIKEKPLQTSTIGRGSSNAHQQQTLTDFNFYQSQNLQSNQQDIEYFENQLQMEKIFFQASVNINKSTYFIILESKDNERDKDFGYELLNQCSNVHISVQQNLVQLLENDYNQQILEDDATNNEIFQLNYNQQVSFAWKYPDNKPEIRINFQPPPASEKQIDNFNFTIATDHNQQKHVETINLFNFQNQKDITFKSKGSTYKIRILAQFRKNTKILSFLPIHDNPQSSKLMDSQNIIEEKLNMNGGGSSSNRRLTINNQYDLKIKASTKNNGDTDRVASENNLDNNGAEKSSNSGNEEKNIVQKVICVHLKNVGISFITRTKKQNRELNYITLKGLIFETHEKETSTQTHVQIKYFQIDNNSSRKTLTPVNLTPSSNQLIQNTSVNFFEFILERDHKDSSVLVINSLRAYLFPTTIKIDEEYLDHLLEAIQNVRTNLTNENQLTISRKMELTHFLFPNEDERKQLENTENIKHVAEKCLYEWQYDDIPEMKKFIYIKEMILHKIQINISFHNRIVQEQQIKGHKKFVGLNVIADALGTAFRNIDEAPVKLSGFKIEDQFGTTPNIIHKIREHYKQCVISALFSVLGSVEIIGNPINLYRRIKQGVEDIALKPLEGLRNEGFVGFGVGMMEGTGSLMKNALAGTCYSLNKFSGSLASGLSIISSDNEFIEARKKLMLNKPKHVLQGLQQAGLCIYKGFEGGIKGVVMHPYRGGVDDGVTGFLKGTLKGVSGIITKPLSGALDATAKTAEGLTSVFTVDEDKSRDQRMRLPRILYEKTQYFKEIQDKEEKIVEFLWEKFGENQEIEVIDTFIVKEPIQGRKSLQIKKKQYITKILILLKDNIFYINQDKKTPEFEIKPKEILSFDFKTEPADPDTIIIQIKTTQDKTPKIIKYRRKQHENNQIVEKLKYLTELIE